MIELRSSLMIRTSGKVKILLGLSFSLVLIAVVVAKVEASEGLVELKNLQGGKTRCFAASMMKTDFSYKILLSCRDIVYPTPAGEDFFHYVVWARGATDNKDIRLGTLDIGRKEFGIKTPFSSLFVSQEKSPDVKKPSEFILLEGAVEQIEFLESEPKAETAEELSESTEAKGKTNEEMLSKENQENNRFLAGGSSKASEESKSLASQSNGVSIVRILGGILLGIVVFVIIVGVVNASRRRPIE